MDDYENVAEDDDFWGDSSEEVFHDHGISAAGNELHDGTVHHTKSNTLISPNAPKRTSPAEPYDVETIFRLIRMGDKDALRQYLQDYQSELTLNFLYAQGTPMMIAALAGRNDIIDLLSEFGADINLVNEVNGQVALHYAAQGQYYHTMLYLLTKYHAIIPNLHLYDYTGSEEQHHVAGSIPSSVTPSNLIEFTLRHYDPTSTILERYADVAHDDKSRAKAHLNGLFSSLQLLIVSPSLDERDFTSPVTLSLYFDRVLRTIEPRHSLSVNKPLPKIIPDKDEYHILTRMVPPLCLASLLTTEIKKQPTRMNQSQLILRQKNLEIILEAWFHLSFRYHAKDWGFTNEPLTDEDKQRCLFGPIESDPIALIRCALQNDIPWQSIIGLTILIGFSYSSKDDNVKLFMQILEVYQTEIKGLYHGQDLVSHILEILLYVCGSSVHNHHPLSDHLQQQLPLAFPSMQNYLQSICTSSIYTHPMFARAPLVETISLSKDCTVPAAIENRLRLSCLFLRTTVNAFTSMSILLANMATSLSQDACLFLLQELSVLDVPKQLLPPSQLSSVNDPPHPFAALLSAGHYEPILHFIITNPSGFQAIVSQSAAIMPASLLKFVAQLSAYWHDNDISQVYEQYLKGSSDTSGLLTPQQIIFRIFHTFWSLDLPIVYEVDFVGLLLDCIQQDTYDFYTLKQLELLASRQATSTVTIHPDLVDDETHDEMGSDDFGMDHDTTTDKITFLKHRIVNRYLLLQFTSKYQQIYPALYNAYFSPSVEALALILSHISHRYNSQSLFNFIIHHLSQASNIAVKSSQIYCYLCPTPNYRTFYVFFKQLSQQLTHVQPREGTVFHRYCNRIPPDCCDEKGSSRIDKSSGTSCQVLVYPRDHSTELFSMLSSLHAYAAHAHLNKTRVEAKQLTNAMIPRAASSSVGLRFDDHATIGEQYKPLNSNWKDWVFVLPVWWGLQLKRGNNGIYTFNAGEYIDYINYSPFFNHDDLCEILSRVLRHSDHINALLQAPYNHSTLTTTYTPAPFFVPTLESMFTSSSHDFRYGFAIKTSTSKTEEGTMVNSSHLPVLYQPLSKESSSTITTLKKDVSAKSLSDYVPYIYSHQYTSQSNQNQRYAQYSLNACTMIKLANVKVYQTPTAVINKLD